jgi:hypothetical protein
MSKKAGALLWNRRRLDFEGGPVDIDTGLTQVNKSFGGMSLNEPGLASRTQVVPLSPIAGWAGVTHGEPFFDPATGTVHVTITTPGVTTLNVLFWDPHSILGPGDADPYGG